MSPTLDASFVLEHANERSRALRLEIERLQAKDYAFPLPRTILRILGDRAREAANALASLESDPVFIHPKTPLTERIDAIRTAAASIQWVHDALVLVDGVDSSRLPFELVGAFERLATDLLKLADPAQLLLKPARGYNYSILGLRSPITRLWPQAAPELEGAYLLTFPSSEPASALIHTLFLHELGHPLFHLKFRNELEAAFSTAMTRAEATLQSKIDTAVSGRLAALGIPLPVPSSPPQLWQKKAIEERAVLLGEAFRIAWSWIEEISCDLVATRLAGPAYLCAFQAFFLPLFSTTRSSRSHPNPWLRLSIMQRYLQEDRMQQPELAEICARFPDVTSLIAELEPPDGLAPVLPFALAELVLNPSGEFVSALYQTIRTSVPGPLSVPGLVTAIDRAVEALADLVPPHPYLYFQRSTAVPSHVVAPFVFYATWLFRLTRISEWQRRYAWNAEKCTQVLNEMALKGLEIGDMLGRYRDKAPACPS